jgi:hypothetical protein
MANNLTQIPAIRVPIIDSQTGLMSREWYRFFVNLFDLTGEGSNVTSLADLQVGPPPVETSPAGSSTQIQYNNGGVFGGSANFTYDTGTNTFTVGPAGAITIIETLAPTDATLAGTLRFQGKNASKANGNGGGFEFFSGDGLGTGVGGDFDFRCGLGPAGSGSTLFRTNSFTVIKVTEDLTPAPLLGFYGATPVTQAAAYTKTYSTASRIVPVATFTDLVTTAATNVTPYGFTTAAQANAIATKVNALAADVLILKQLIVSLVDDSSTTLGVGLNAT